MESELIFSPLESKEQISNIIVKQIEKANFEKNSCPVLNCLLNMNCVISSVSAGLP